MRSLGGTLQGAGQKVFDGPEGERRVLMYRAGPALAANERARAQAAQARAAAQPRDRRSAWTRLVERFKAGEVIAMPRWIGTTAMAAVMAVVGLYGMTQGGHTLRVQDEIRFALNEWTRGAGLGIKTVRMAGLKELEDWEVLEALDVDETKSLFTFDVGEARMKLEAIPWVQRAAVQKLYPASLKVDITERDAFALWQSDGRVSVVDIEGRVLEEMRDPRFARLPLVVGDDAAVEARALIALLDEHPGLRSKVRAAMRVSGRRWTLMMHDGLEVSLPAEGVGTALAYLAEADRTSGLLARDIVSVDLRLADKMVVRLSDEAAEKRVEMLEAEARARRRGART